MVLNTQPIENKGYSEPTSPYATKSWNSGWKNKYWLIVIAVVCLILCGFGASLLENSLVQWIVKYLPVVGSIAFASEGIIKLVKND